MSRRDRPTTRIAAMTAALLIGASVLVSACGGGDEPASDTTQSTIPSTGEKAPTTTPDVTLTGLDVEMHYAYG